MRPTFSIIVPIYNVAGYLEKCLESLVSQTYPKIEIILIDDGSTDESPRICDDFASRDNRIKVIHKVNEKTAEARNVGLRQATGDYILFVDGDDMIVPQTCEVFAQFINKYPSAEMIHAQICSTPVSLVNNGQYIDKPLEWIKRCIIENKFHFVIWRKVYRRDFIMENDLFFEKGNVVEDFLWTIKTYLHVTKAISIDFPFYTCVQRPTSTSRNWDERYCIDMLFCIYQSAELVSSYQDTELKILLDDFLVRTYFVLYMSKNKEQRRHFRIKKTFLKGKSQSRQNKLNVFFYCIHPELLFVVTKIYSFFYKIVWGQPR